MILKLSVERILIIIMNSLFYTYSVFVMQPLNRFAYSFDCTFVSFICLTAKILHRITMLDFLDGATEADKRTLKRVQLRVSG